jgi:hypothetical protein
LKQSAEVEARLEASGLEALEYEKREGTYRIRLDAEELAKQYDVIQQLIEMAFREQAG